MLMTSNIKPEEEQKIKVMLSRCSHIREHQSSWYHIHNKDNDMVSLVHLRSLDSRCTEGFATTGSIKTCKASTKKEVSNLNNLITSYRW